MSRQLLHPVRWTPPVAPDRAWRRRSDPPLPGVHRFELGVEGPEDVRFDTDGWLLTGVADGRILRVDPSTGAVATVTDTGGRSLGLHVSADGSLLVCDARRGLLRVDRATGASRVLVAAVDGVELTFASNVVEAPDGLVYFTASTRRFAVEDYTGDILEHSGTGRLLRWDPSGDVQVLLDGLQFANGLVLAPDGSSIVVAETGEFRLTRYWLDGARAGTSEPFAELPGYPDNLSVGSDGLIWVAVAAPRNRLADRLAPRAPWLRQATWLLPDALRPKPARTVWVLGVGFDATVVHDLQTSDGNYRFVTSVLERDGTLYLGSLHDTAVGVTHVPGRSA